MIEVIIGANHRGVLIRLKAKFCCYLAHPTLCLSPPFFHESVPLSSRLWFFFMQV